MTGKLNISTIRTIVETLGYDPNEYLPEETRNHVPGYENNLFNQKETKQKDIEKQLKEAFKEVKEPEAANNDEDETTDALAGSPRGHKLAVV